MGDKELYEQKKQAQLDEWKADLDKLKAKASGASADAQLEMNKQIKALESKIEEGKAKLSELAKAGLELPRKVPSARPAPRTSVCNPFFTALFIKLSELDNLKAFV